MIELKNVCFGYEKEFVLKNINLNIEKGSFTAIIGANGSGKTTLAKHLNALLLPSKGEVLIDGVSTKNEDFARKKVGFVFQNFEDQIVYPIVEEDIGFGLENLGLGEHDVKKKAREICEKLGIMHLFTKNVNELSLGQKQMVAIAGVLAMNPEYIVFDEPTTMLDATNKNKAIGLIRKLKSEGKTVILVTNSVQDLKLADNFIVLKSGHLFYSGKKISKKTLKGAGLE